MTAHVASKNNKLIRLRRISVFLPSSLLAGIQRRVFMKTGHATSSCPNVVCRQRTAYIGLTGSQMSTMNLPSGCCLGSFR